MNSTFDAIAELASKKKTRLLRDAVSECIDGHDVDTVLAALIPLIIAVHLDSHVEDDLTICETCSNTKLTELLQALRKINDQIMDGISEDE